MLAGLLGAAPASGSPSLVLWVSLGAGWYGESSCRSVPSTAWPLAAPWAVGHSLPGCTPPLWVTVGMWGPLRRVSTGGCAVFGPRTPPRLRRGVSRIAVGTGLGGVPPPRVYRGVRRPRASHPPALAVVGPRRCRWASFRARGCGLPRLWGWVPEGFASKARVRDM